MAPPWTNAWDETKPADSDLANTIGVQGRQTRLDTRQRLDWQHVWGQSVNDDGGHRNIVIASSYMTANQEAFKASGFSLTGANAQSVLDLAGTWNTSGTPTAIKQNITDTASNANSLLLDLQVGGSSKFAVKKDGTILQRGLVFGTGVIPARVYAIDLNQENTISNGYTASALKTLTITPSDVTHQIVLFGVVRIGALHSSGSGFNGCTCALFRSVGGSTPVLYYEFASNLSRIYFNPTDGNTGDATTLLPIHITDTANTTSPVTYRIYWHSNVLGEVAYVSNFTMTAFEVTA